MMRVRISHSQPEFLWVGSLTAKRVTVDHHMKVRSLPFPPNIFMPPCWNWRFIKRLERLALNGLGVRIPSAALEFLMPRCWNWYSMRSQKP